MTTAGATEEVAGVGGGGGTETECGCGGTEVLEAAKAGADTGLDGESSEEAVDELFSP